MVFLQELILLVSLFATCLGFEQILLRDSTMDDENCATTVFEISTPSFISCSFKCGKDSTCLSVFYDTGTSTCYGCDARHSSSDTLPTLTGSIYVEKPVPVGFGEVCGGSAICDTKLHLKCDYASEQCVCKAGYSSYQSSCVTVCPLGYGSTFTMHDYSYIFLADISSAYFDNEQECKDHCLAMFPIPCASFDLEKIARLIGKVNCYFQLVGTPVVWTPFYEYYQRNCA